MRSNNLSLREEIRTEDLWKLMWKLTPVAVLAMSINSINTFVDALFVGQFLGESALAAVSLAFAISFMTNGFAAMIGVGAASLLSIAIGAKDYFKQKRVFGTVVCLSIVVALLLTSLGWYFAEAMISGIGGSGAVLELGVLYYRTLILGAVFQIMAVAINMIIRAEGKIKVAMFMAMTSVITNMILNPLFIGYFKMGIAGTAYATIISMVLFTSMGLLYFFRRSSSYEVDLSYFRLEKKMVRPILSVGVAAMMLQMMFVLQQVVVFKMLDIYGEDRDIAFMGACYRVIILMLVPGFGFSSAMQPVTGINFGAKDYARVKRAFFVFTFGSLVVTTSLMMFFEIFPNMVLGWMLPNTVFSAQDILNFRLFISPGFMISVFLMASIFYQSIGNARIAGIVIVMREIILFIPAVLILPLYFNKMGIYLTPLVQNTFTLTVVLYLLVRTFRKWDRGVVV